MIAPDQHEQAPKSRIRSLAFRYRISPALRGDGGCVIRHFSSQASLIPTPRDPTFDERDGAFVIGAATPGAVIGECEALQQAWKIPCSRVTIPCSAGLRFAGTATNFFLLMEGKLTAAFYHRALICVNGAIGQSWL